MLLRSLKILSILGDKRFATSQISARQLLVP